MGLIRIVSVTLIQRDLRAYIFMDKLHTFLWINQKRLLNTSLMSNPDSTSSGTEIICNIIIISVLFSPSHNYACCVCSYVIKSRNGFWVYNLSLFKLNTIFVISQASHKQGLQGIHDYRWPYICTVWSVLIELNWIAYCQLLFFQTLRGQNFRFEITLVWGNSC